MQAAEAGVGDVAEFEGAVAHDLLEGVGLVGGQFGGVARQRRHPATQPGGMRGVECGASDSGATQDIALYQGIPGLSEPWRVKSVRLNRDAGEVVAGSGAPFTAPPDGAVPGARHLTWD